MFFKKEKQMSENVNPDIIKESEATVETESLNSNDVLPEDVAADNLAPEESPYPYTFYKPEPFPKDLASVISKMLQKMFPDTRKAYLLEAQQNKKKGYLLIVDIDAKFLKIINIYLDGETKRVRGNVPIECVLYSKSGTLTEGIDPFYVKETAESKANNLASKEFSGEITFSDMPEFELWGLSGKKDASLKKNEDEEKALDDTNEDSENKKDDAVNDVPADKSDVKPDDTTIEETKEEQKEKPQEKAEEKDEEKSEEKPQEKTEEIPEEKSEEKPEEKPQTKVKPTTKQELFSLLNEYGVKKKGAVYTIASAAVKEFEFFIPYYLKNTAFSDTIDNTLPIDDSLRFKLVINPENEMKAVPLFTQMEDALSYAKRDNCKIVQLKYKDFASSKAAEQTMHDGIVINPEGECIFMQLTHPLLCE